MNIMTTIIEFSINAISILSATKIQKTYRGFHTRNQKINNHIIPHANYQTKKWRQNQSWYKTGLSNECEIYQRNIIDQITKKTCSKTSNRINIITKEMKQLKQPMKEIDGFEWTEDFDGFIQHDKNDIYFNMKFVCNSGGGQTRTLREVYHFITCQLEHLIKFYNTSSMTIPYFINILDGDTSSKHMEKFNYLLKKKEYETVSKQVFVGDMHDFQKYWIKSFSSNHDQRGGNNTCGLR